MSEKLDLYKEHKEEYVAKKIPSILKVRPAKYLTIEGGGDPGGKEFQDCIGALYAIAFTIKMAKKLSGHDYHVAKLEGIWSEFESGAPYKWKLLIRTPEFIKQRDVDTAVEVSLSQGKHSLVEQVKLETIDEGTVVQALHVGPYGEEPDTIHSMEEFAAEHGFRLRGPHHEIYLSDPRKVPPQNLKTILRQPLVPAT